MNCNKISFSKISDFSNRYSDIQINPSLIKRNTFTRYFYYWYEISTCTRLASVNFTKAKRYWKKVNNILSIILRQLKTNWFSPRTWVFLFFYKLKLSCNTIHLPLNSQYVITLNDWKMIFQFGFINDMTLLVKIDNGVILDLVWRHIFKNDYSLLVNNKNVIMLIMFTYKEQNATSSFVI